MKLCGCGARFVGLGGACGPCERAARNRGKAVTTVTDAPKRRHARDKAETLEEPTI